MDIKLPREPRVRFRGITVDTAGNSYVIAATGTSFPEVYKFLLLKYNTNGILQWARTYGDTTHAYYPNDVIIDRDGNIYEVGQTDAYNDVRVLVENTHRMEIQYGLKIMYIPDIP